MEVLHFQYSTLHIEKLLKRWIHEFLDHYEWDYGTKRTKVSNLNKFVMSFTLSSTLWERWSLKLMWPQVSPLVGSMWTYTPPSSVKWRQCTVHRDLLSWVEWYSSSLWCWKSWVDVHKAVRPLTLPRWQTGLHLSSWHSSPSDSVHACFFHLCLWTVQRQKGRAPSYLCVYRA